MSSKLRPGEEPPRFTPRAAPPKTRAEKAFTSLEGDDEFSIASTDPDAGNKGVELNPKDTDARPEATGDRRTLWRLFRKLF